MVVDNALELKQLVDGLAANRPAIVRDISLFDVYVGRGVEAGKKSLAFRIAVSYTHLDVYKRQDRYADPFYGGCGSRGDHPDHARSRP